MKKEFSEQPKEVGGFKEDEVTLFSIVLYNDDFNHYDFVVKSLMEVCKHNSIQAEQCTLLAHHKGKCDVKKGDLYLLKPIKNELLHRGLTATIE